MSGQIKLKQLSASGATDRQKVEYNSTTGLWEPVTIVHATTFSESPTANGIIYLLGWYILTNSAASLTSAGPVTAGEAGYHSHFVLDVSAAAGLPFTIRITGTSINEITGATTASDTEDLSVTANGYYQSTKSWVDAVEFSIVEGSKSCTIDAYRVTYWDDGNSDFVLSGIRLEWTPDAPTWSIQFRLLHVENDGSFTLLDDVTFDNNDALLRAEKDMPGKYKRLDYNHPNVGSQNEGIIVEIDQSGIGNFFVEMKHDD